MRSIEEIRIYIENNTAHKPSDDFKIIHDSSEYVHSFLPSGHGRKSIHRSVFFNIDYSINVKNTDLVVNHFIEFLNLNAYQEFNRTIRIIDLSEKLEYTMEYFS